MGADQNLIRAAGEMGPKPWDYSGLMRGIAALGKYAATKQAVADELTSYGNKAFDTKEMPDAIINGPFGEQNMGFITQAKNHYNNAVTTYRNPLNLPFTKKYKQAIKDVNTIQSVLEKNKADLLVLAEVKKNVNENWQNRSNGISRESFHRMADLQINNTTGDLDNAMILGPDGIEIYVNDVVNMQTAAFSPDELMNGFFTNHMNSDNNNSNLRKIIKNNGEKRKNTDKQWREGDARDQIRDFMEKLKAKKEYGNNGIKSLAFDFESTLGGGSFVQTNGNLFIDPTLSGDDATTTYVQQYMSINPDATEEEIKLAYNHQAADVWNSSGADYETRIENWLVGIAKADYDKAQPKTELGKGDNLKLGWVGEDNTAVYLKPEELPNIVKGIKERTTFIVDGTRFKYLNDQWAWKVDGPFKPVMGAEGQNYNYKDGSSEALLYRLGNNSKIAEALGLNSANIPPSVNDSTQVTNDSTLQVFKK